MWLRCVCGSSLRAHVLHHPLTQRTDGVGLAHRALLPELRLNDPRFSGRGCPSRHRYSIGLLPALSAHAPRAAGRSGATSCPDPVPLKPERHIFVAEKMPWIEIGDSLPQFEYSAKNGSPMACAAKRLAG